VFTLNNVKACLAIDDATLDLARIAFSSFLDARMMCKIEDIY